MVNVRYEIKPGKRNEFFEKVNEQGIITASKEEPGNFKYDYYIPLDSENALVLLEMWVNSEAQAAHGKAEHYQKLQALKKEYVTKVEIEKYSINDIS
ncbi:MAG: putative quinol monooxygenase [Bacillota bacterium]|nr:putative quinol monooxygenase [Bacillota bacterium]